MASRKEDAFGPHDLYLGVDVGKSFHWAVAVDGEGEVAADRPLPNRKADVDALLDEAGDPRWNPDSYRPRDPDEELKLAKRLEGIARERDLDSLEQLDRLTATIRATIGPRGGMRP